MMNLCHVLLIQTEQFMRKVVRKGHELCPEEMICTEIQGSADVIRIDRLKSYRYICVNYVLRCS